MKWVVCYLTMSDNLKYITDVMDKPAWLSYNRFMEFIKEIPIQRRDIFLKSINQFDTLKLDSNGKWEIMRPSYKQDNISHEKLSEINKEKIYNPLMKELKKDPQKEKYLRLKKIQNKLFRKHNNGYKP